MLALEHNHVVYYSASSVLICMYFIGPYTPFFLPLSVPPCLFLIAKTLTTTYYDLFRLLVMLALGTQAPKIEDLLGIPQLSTG